MAAPSNNAANNLVAIQTAFQGVIEEVPANDNRALQLISQRLALIALAAIATIISQIEQGTFQEWEPLKTTVNVLKDQEKALTPAQQTVKTTILNQLQQLTSNNVSFQEVFVVTMKG